jgi:hypothetical protein
VRASERVIARSVRIARTAIGKNIRGAAVVGITWPLPEELDDAALECKLFALAGYNPSRSHFRRCNSCAIGSVRRVSSAYVFLPPASEHVRDARVLRLIRQWFRAGVMLEGTVTDTPIGAPQGAVILPLLSNIYLHPLDLYWEQEVRDTKMVRYADDLVVLCRWRPAEAYMPKLQAMLSRLRVTVNEDKTRIVPASTGSTSRRALP